MTRIALVLGVGLLLAVSFGCAERQVADEENPIGGGPTPAEGEMYPDEATDQGPYKVLDAVVEPWMFTGEEVVGQATVVEVISDRALWLTAGGEWMFAVIRERAEGGEQVELATGQVLQLRGVLLPADERASIEGELDADAVEVLDRQDYYLALSPNSIQVVSRSAASSTAR